MTRGAESVRLLITTVDVDSLDLAVEMTAAASDALVSEVDISAYFAPIGSEGQHVNGAGCGLV
jgi:hypothetical protein